MKLPLQIYAVTWGLLLSSLAYCADLLPYSLRTRPYAGMATNVRGDIRTVGMAGATMGLGDTFMAASDNPAGLAMTLNGGDDNYVSNQIKDGVVQNYNEPIFAQSLGVALNLYPWGFALGYANRYREEQAYTIPGLPNDPAVAQVALKEFSVMAGRVFFDNKLAIGIKLNLAEAFEQLQFGNDALPSVSQRALALTGSIGANYQLPRRFLLGFGYSPPTRFDFEADARTGSTLPGFFQSMDVPSRLGLGLGWIPNRFFRADFTTYLIGTTANTALVRDQSISVGKKPTLQPHLGAGYLFSEFKNFTATLFAGTYYENSRIDQGLDRTHVTFGIETKPWVLTVGMGLDAAQQYSNYLVSVGIDVFKVMAKLDLLPPAPAHDYAGWFPNPTHLSDRGLARPLVENWSPDQKGIDPIQAGLELPSRVSEKIRSVPGELQNLGKETIEILKGVIPSNSEKEPPRRRVHGPEN